MSWSFPSRSRDAAPWRPLCPCCQPAAERAPLPWRLRTAAPDAATEPPATPAPAQRRVRRRGVAR